MAKKAPIPLKKRQTKTGRKGGQLGNVNAQVYGAFTQINTKKIDGRTREGKTIIAARSALVSTIGGDPTPQESILIDRIVFKMLRCTLYEMATLQGTTSGGSDHIYLAWANSLRLDLQSLGLTRKTKDVIDLSHYLKKHAKAISR